LSNALSASQPARPVTNEAKTADMTNPGTRFRDMDANKDCRAS
jgi:hypothetical protein